MNERTAGAIMLVIGVVAIFAAIVGGGIKIQQIEVGSLPSKWRQWLLAGFGLIVGIVGLVMVVGTGDSAPQAESENVGAVDANAVDENAPVDENLVDANVADESNADSNEVAAPEENSDPQ